MARKTKPTVKKSLRTEARKPIARRDVANKRGTAEVYGVPSPMNQTAFRIPVAVIRTDAAVARLCPKGPELSKLLGLIMSDPELPPHGTGDITVSLARNRAIQERLAAKAQVAAETVWPGYSEMMAVLIDRENEFVKALGELGVGVA